MSLFEIIMEYKQGLISGLVVTGQLCITTWVGGVAGGVILGILGSIYSNSIGKFNKLMTTFLGGIPILVVLYWLYFPFQHLFSLDIEPFFLAVGCFILINTFIIAHIVRKAVTNLPQRFINIAKVTGLSKRKTITKIKLPLITKRILGPVLMVQITMMHNTIFASLINVDDVFRQVQRINAIVYKPIELYSLVAILFVVVSVPLYVLASYFQRKYNTTY